eukprot:scaffold72762_cov63-Phaeocystis_antarctica.AAC.3
MVVAQQRPYHLPLLPQSSRDITPSRHGGQLLEATLPTKVATQGAVGAHEGLVAGALARLGPVGAPRIAVRALDGGHRHGSLGPRHPGRCGGARGPQSL